MKWNNIKLLIKYLSFYYNMILYKQNINIIYIKLMFVGRYFFLFTFYFCARVVKWNNLKAYKN